MADIINLGKTREERKEAEIEKAMEPLIARIEQHWWHDIRKVMLQCPIGLWGNVLVSLVAEWTKEWNKKGGNKHPKEMIDSLAEHALKSALTPGLGDAMALAYDEIEELHRKHNERCEAEIRESYKACEKVVISHELGRLMHDAIRHSSKQAVHAELSRLAGKSPEPPRYELYSTALKVLMCDAIHRSGEQTVRAELLRLVEQASAESRAKAALQQHASVSKEIAAHEKRLTRLKAELKTIATPVCVG